MNESHIVNGYLGVKTSFRCGKVIGLNAWKTWKRQWCEIQRLDNIDNGVELKVRSAPGNPVLYTFILSRSSTLCRTESRTKQYAFGVFLMGKRNKPVIFLSGESETESQKWMFSIRKMLCVASYLPVGELNFHISIIDNLHSKKANLIGLYGVLRFNTQHISISDPCTGDVLVLWTWHEFHQFHIQASSHPDDNKMIVVMHTSSDFIAGPGQLFLYCKRAENLLSYLLARGNISKFSPGLASLKRLSRSEGDLSGFPSSRTSSFGSPMYLKSQTGSDDSGVRVSINSVDYEFNFKTKNTASCLNITNASVTKTPGGSEINDDLVQDLAGFESELASGPNLIKHESGVSLASGIYEEIADPIIEKDLVVENVYANHIYENPMDVLDKTCKITKPPPLPPRLNDSSPKSENLPPKSPFRKSFYKQRCNTLPARDLTRISTIFTSECEYVPMSPSKTLSKTKDVIKSLAEGLYLPMTPVKTLKNKLENRYMTMNGKKD